MPEIFPVGTPSQDPSAGITAGVPFTLELRTGVLFPDWSVIVSPTAADALQAILSAFCAAERWTDYGEDQDRVRRAVIEGLAELGRGLDEAWLTARTGLDSDRVSTLLDRLVRADHVVRDGDSGAIAGAYPLTTRSTEHQVRLEKRIVHAMCAIDALGMGAMFGRDIAIESRCRACGAPIRITTRGRGSVLDGASPESTVVWSGEQYEGGCAASSLCTTIAFFCSDAHLDAWRSDNDGQTKGHRLALDEAMQVGRALFGPVLRPARNSKERA